MAGLSFTSYNSSRDVSVKTVYVYDDDNHTANANSSVTMDFDLFSEEIMEAIDKAKGPLITDRTPIDMVGYLMGEFDMLRHRMGDVKEYVINV